jgi:hypothetical protein
LRSNIEKVRALPLIPAPITPAAADRTAVRIRLQNTASPTTISLASSRLGRLLRGVSSRQVSQR